jgi:hypothetical protein
MVEKLVHVEAPDAENALALIEKLLGVHAEVVPIGADRCEVRIELGEEDGLDNVLRAVADWRAAGDLPSSPVRVTDHPRSWREPRDQNAARRGIQIRDGSA